ncbi:MAG: hypothetical protein ACKOTZ_11415 [Chloroflexota bacterium]
MSMATTDPAAVTVDCDRITGTPRTVHAGGDTIPVLAVERVRDESLAYPLTTGPRTVFVVRTPGARMRLAYAYRSRRWSVIGVEAEVVHGLAAA